MSSAYGLRQATGIGVVIARWKNLYFNPFRAEGELRAISRPTHDSGTFEGIEGVVVCQDLNEG